MSELLINPALFLASTSPRRRELLQQIGLSFEVLRVDVDESTQINESPEAYVQRLSLAKAQMGLKQCPNNNDLVLAADTTVVIDNHIIGKPENLEQAIAIWQSLSGRCHQVLTGVTLANHRQSKTIVVTTDVYFCPLTMKEMLGYWQTGEPQDKAGGYGIQGKGALFVEKIDGSYSNVVGLPLTETAQLLRRFAYEL
jgi:septum formation protein